MMAWPTIICGALLVMLGVTGYANSQAANPVTALIPAGFGGVLILCGLLAFNEKLRKHVMHFAAMVGLLGVLGGFAPVIRAVTSADPDKGFDPSAPSQKNGLLMSLVCLVFVGLCVKSFVDARVARRKREQATPTAA